ncbi:TetR/AcrR family transcriptional regulator [Isoptericola sp. NEAU-Y5]|uniref:TetR/AcrR family transcriptional regulator n=1 Tax=Isoptericola luteus TaxID=2879484 RepID=A0ABS7ZMU3_9MICO|nr:TetR/AcrR family transcriptional regulator [Isoptericola sp. NEAU-Y5]MCA5895100.1 TetR/AcrR family transcriptional regulator [Isoptericola sp. NEAU-Y5]
MARTVDPRRHARRRLQIIDAGLSVLAERGYEGATTAAICRRAGIGSGTFFHYFATKRELVLAILELGTAETHEQAAALDGRDDPVGVLLDLVGGWAADAADPRIPGFVRAVAGVMHLPAVATALQADDRAQREVLLPWIERGQAAGEVRRDVPAARIASWLVLLTGGFLERVATDDAFTAVGERDLLVRTAESFLRG